MPSPNLAVGLPSSPLPQGEGAICDVGISLVAVRRPPDVCRLAVPPILPPKGGYLFLDKVRFAAGFAGDCEVRF
jgi:hypothetical protein